MENNDQSGQSITIQTDLIDEVTSPQEIDPKSTSIEGDTVTPNKLDTKPIFLPIITPRRRPAPPPGSRTSLGSASGPPSAASASEISLISGDYASSDEEGGATSSSSTTKKPGQKRIPRRDSFVLMKERTLKMKHLASKTKSFVATRYDSNVVIDTGSHCMRAGFAGEDLPLAQFRNVVVRKPVATVGDLPEYFVGDEAMVESIEDLNTRCLPYSNGAVSSWDQLEAVWDHCFEDCLHVDTPSANVFLTETHLPSKANRETMMETMFELFSVAGLYIHPAPALALYASGSYSGCVVDLGHLSTTVFPVAQGYQLASSCIKTQHGGHHLSQLFLSSLYGRDIISGNNYYRSLLSSQKGRTPLDVARFLKENHVFVDENYEPTPLFAPAEDRDYCLPDGTYIRVGNEFVRCGEAMFRPLMDNDLFDLCEERPLQKIIMESIQSCSIELRKPLLSNIVLTGGTSHIPGFQERLFKEMKAIVPPSIVGSVQVSLAPGGDAAIWIGGSILANLSTFQDQFVTMAEYQENGACCVHEFCPVYL